MALVDYYLKIDGIKGESADSKNKGEIQIESWSWGENNAPSQTQGSGLGAGKVQVQDMHFVSTMSTASLPLAQACAGGKHIPKAVLVCRKAGDKQEVFLTVTLTDLLITSYQTGGSGSSGVVPMDQFSIAFTKIVADYKSQDAKGATSNAGNFSWDQKANAK